MRSPGIRPRSSDWQSDSLLLTYDRKSQKEQTPSEVKLRPQDFTGGAFRDFRNPRILQHYKLKNPTRLHCSSRVNKIFFLSNSLSKPTRLALSSPDFSVVVRSTSHRNTDPICPNGRLLSRLNYGGFASLKVPQS